MNETDKLKRAKRIILVLSAVLVILLILLLCLRSCENAREEETKLSVSPGNHILVPEVTPTPVPAAEAVSSPSASPAPTVTPDYTMPDYTTPVPDPVIYYTPVPTPTPTPEPGYTHDEPIEGTEDTYTSFSLYKRHEEDGEPFSVSNMFPGDSVTKRYTIKTSYIDYITVNFSVTVREGYEKLAEVLQFRIENVDTGEVLYEGNLDELNKVFQQTLTSEEAVEEMITYDITAYIGTDVGNEYMSLPLIADIRWWTENTENLVILHKGNKGSEGSEGSGTAGEGALPEWLRRLIPGTGDEAHPLFWSVVILGSAAVLVVVVTVDRRQKRHVEK